MEQIIISSLLGTSMPAQVIPGPFLCSISYGIQYSKAVCWIVQGINRDSRNAMPLTTSATRIPQTRPRIPGAAPGSKVGGRDSLAGSVFSSVWFKPAFFCSFLDISRTFSAPTFLPLLSQPYFGLNKLHEVTRSEKLQKMIK